MKTHRLCVLLLLISLIGCASKPVGPKVVELSKSELLPGEYPLDAENTDPKIPTSPEMSGAINTNAPTDVRKEGITLVLGGVGIASFATVGMIKRFVEEGIHINRIIATGWPALFSVGYAFFSSVHDLEWYAMRLDRKDFFDSKLFGKNVYVSRDKLKNLLSRSFPKKPLHQARIPVIIGVWGGGLNESTAARWYDEGDYGQPLFATMDIAGIFEALPEKLGETDIESLRAMDVDEALRRSAERVVAVNMYGDYLRILQQQNDQPLAKMLAQRLRSSIRQESGLAHVSGNIVLETTPMDFSKKRAAILAGYKEARRLIHLLRKKE